MESELDLRAICRSLTVLLPVFLAAVFSGDMRWSHALLPVAALMVSHERAGLGPAGVMVQAALMILCFVGLSLSQALPPLFVANCAILAALSMALSERAEGLRTVGTFVFVPALYLACGIASSVPTAAYSAQIRAWLPFVLAGCLPVFALALLDHWRALRAAQHGWSWRGLMLCRPMLARASQPAGVPTLAAACAVAVAASFVVVLHPDNPQWIIWSAASVVQGDLASSRRKALDRLLGAAFGVPLGILLGFALPHAQFVGLALGVISCTTVLAIRRPVLSFGARCLCAACSIVIANHAVLLASERFFNVAAGGLIGLASLYALRLALGQGITRQG